MHSDAPLEISETNFCNLKRNTLTTDWSEFQVGGIALFHCGAGVGIHSNSSTWRVNNVLPCQSESKKYVCLSSSLETSFARCPCSSTNSSNYGRL